MEMTEEFLNLIRRAIEIIMVGGIDKLEGDGWKVYRVGKTIRIDLQ